MPARIVRQPDGRLARFSSVVDAFTHYNMSAEEAGEVCLADMGRRDAEEKVQRGLRDEDHRGRAGDGLTRWRDALEDMVLNRDIEEAVALLRQIGDWPEWETYVRAYASKNGCNAAGAA